MHDEAHRGWAIALRNRADVRLERSASGARIYGRSYRPAAVAGSGVKSIRGTVRLRANDWNVKAATGHLCPFASQQRGLRLNMS
jgi:hypothetical protein